MTISSQHLLALSQLLDEALLLPEHSRDSWLEKVSAQHPELTPTLRSILSRQLDLDGNSLFATLPKFTVTSNAIGTSEQFSTGMHIGPYTLVRELGRGGMGEVWLAIRNDGVFNRQVALKLPHAHLLAGKLRQRFDREREILAALSHPNIATLYDAGITDTGQPYLALEFVDGIAITDYCDQQRLSVDERIQVFRQVLDAVRYAHSHLIIHRDLKPSNILTTNAGRCMLLDFGIAKLVDEGVAMETQLTMIGGRILTPHYASPEQISGSLLTTASDVYSLGVILYELLTGTKPYKLQRSSSGALEEAILAANPIKPSHVAFEKNVTDSRNTTIKKLCTALRGDLEVIVMKALKKEPGARYATVDAFREDIERYLSGFPIHAKADSLWYRAEKFVARNRLTVGAGAAVLVALIAGLAIALWQAQRAINEARTANSVEQFLQNVFLANSNQQPDPVKMRQTTARELLNVGAKNIDESLKDAPLAKLRMLKIFGDLDHQLYMDDEGVALRHKQVAMAKSLFGPTDARVAAALVDLSESLQAAQVTAERDAVLNEARSILDANHDQSSRLRGVLMGEFAQCYFDRDLRAAIAYAQDSVRILRPYGPSSELAEALIMEGTLRNQRNEYQQAIAPLTEAMQISARVQGPTNPKLVRINHYLAEAEYFSGHWPEAEQSLREALRIARKIGDENDESTIQSEYRLGMFLFRTARTHEGLALVKQARDNIVRISPSDDAWYVPMLRESYGYFLGEYGSLEDGLIDLDAATVRWRQFHQGTSDEISSLERNAELLTAMGRMQDADELLNESESIRKKLGDESTYPNGDIVARSNWLIANSRLDEAEQVISRFIIKPTEKNSAAISSYQHALQLAKLQLARHDAQAVIETLTPLLNDITHHALRPYLKGYEADTKLALGKAKMMLRKDAEAQPLLKEALSSYLELFDSRTSLRIADAQIALAESLLVARDLQQAHVLYVKARDAHRLHKEIGQQYKKPLLELQAQLNKEHKDPI